MINIFPRAGKPALFSAGFFCTCWSDIWFRTPVWKCNATTALGVLVNGKGGTVFYFRPHFIIPNVMRTVDLTPKKQNNEVSTRKIRCLSSPQSTLGRKLPSISLAGVWLKEAGFEVGDFARIVVLDGVLVVSCERLPGNENREDWKRESVNGRLSGKWQPLLFYFWGACGTGFFGWKSLWISG